MHSPSGFVYLTHQNLSARALFCLNSLAKVNTQLLIYKWLCNWYLDLLLSFESIIQWRSHWGGKDGQSATLDSEKIAKNQEKSEKKLGKIGKNSGKIGKKEKKSGRKGTLPLLTDRAGYATAIIWSPNKHTPGIRTKLYTQSTQENLTCELELTSIQWHGVSRSWCFPWPPAMCQADSLAALAHKPPLLCHVRSY